MVMVQEATFVPTVGGGEIRASMRLGPQVLTSSWSLGESSEDLRLLLDRLMVKVEQVTFVTTPTGGEIRATMRVGERAFVSRVAIDGKDKDLKPLLDQLLEEVGGNFVQALQSALGSGDSALQDVPLSVES